VDARDADVSWLIYDLEYNKKKNVYNIKLSRTVHTKFKDALDQITRCDAGDVSEFVATLQSKLDEKLDEERGPNDGPALKTLLST